MNWTITKTQSEDAWLEDYVSAVITDPIPALPPHNYKVAHVEAHWHEVYPGEVYVAANGGTWQDQDVVQRILMAKLRGFGYKQAVYKFSDMGDTTLAQPRQPGGQFDKIYGPEDVDRWQDILDKAERLVHAGNVDIHNNSSTHVSAGVQGDHGNYDTELWREDPANRGWTRSSCTCDWGNFQNTPRTRTWQRFQNRPCAHIIATGWQSLITPLDDQPDQPAMYYRGLGEGVENNARAPGQTYFGVPTQFQRIKRDQWQPGQPPGGGGGPQQGQPMSPEESLPPYPMDQGEAPQPQGLAGQPPQPASTPGGGPGPSPTNPINYPQGPGGAFSSYDPATIRRVFSASQFTVGQQVQLLEDDVGTLVGRSEAHGAGKPTQLKAGQIGEVRGVDEVGGQTLVEVLFMDRYQRNKQMEPYGATATFWGNQLQPRNDIKAPGPAIVRY